MKQPITYAIIFDISPYLESFWHKDFFKTGSRALEFHIEEWSTSCSFGIKDDIVTGKQDNEL